MKYKVFNSSWITKWIIHLIQLVQKWDIGWGIYPAFFKVDCCLVSMVCAASLVFVLCMFWPFKGSVGMGGAYTWVLGRFCRLCVVFAGALARVGGTPPNILFSSETILMQSMCALKNCKTCVHFMNTYSWIINEVPQASVNTALLLLVLILEMYNLA